jgi:membrane protein implicated in regulation of membrane protease activity
MSGTNKHPDDLQQLWQQDNEPIHKENIPMIMRLVQEKRRSYFELIDTELYRHYKEAVLVAIASAYLALNAPLLPARIGWSFIAVFCIAFAIHARRARRRKNQATHEQDARAYCNELVGLYERRIRDVQAARWFAFPAAVLMVTLVVWPYLGPWGSLFLAVAMTLLWFLLGQRSAETARDLQRRQDEVVGLLKEMDRS